MYKRFLLFITLIFLLAAAGLQPVFADGIIIIEPTPCAGGRGCIITPVPMLSSILDIKYHHVDVKIENQVAITHVDQVFYNPTDVVVEGIYLFPLPAEAVVSNFILWIDGKPVEGKVLDANEARQTYEEIVRQMRDPALLEYVGRGAVRASVYPIPPKGERRIELSYTQVLTAQKGLVQYVYPLNTEKFSAKPLESVSVSVNITSQESIRAVYSPSHVIAMNKTDNTHATASYEASNVLPDKDFILYYSLGETEAFHIMSYRDPGDSLDKDGFFLLLLAPKPDEGNGIIEKDVLIVLDRSGSMDGVKFSQAQAAARYILGHLNPKDRFYISTFNDEIGVYANELRPASDASSAVTWLDSISAVGSTDINRALLEAAAVSDKEKPTYLIFLTDGLPTSGVKETQAILDNFKSTAPDNLRLFAFGLGYDVDTFLLDTLTQEHHGLSSYVKPEEPLDEILSGFYARISTPVLTNLKLDFGSLSPYDLYPSPLPDLFAGSQVVVVGRYRVDSSNENNLTPDIKLSGMVNGKLQEFVYPEQVFSKDSREVSNASNTIPRLWATRKIGYLLNKIRLQGADEETVNQIVKLSLRYGIVTPYTSFLVTESMPALGMESQEDFAKETYDNLQSQPTQPASGQAAVEKAQNEGDLAQAEVPSSISGEAGQRVRTIGARTFILIDGTWVDTSFDPGKMKLTPIVFLSDDYFSFAQSRADLGTSLALGSHIVIVLDGTAYEILPEGSAAITYVPSIQVTQGGDMVLSATPLPGGETQVVPTGTQVVLRKTVSSTLKVTQTQSPSTEPGNPTQNLEFPLAVMAAAAVVLGSGFILLFFRNKK